MVGEFPVGCDAASLIAAFDAHDRFRASLVAALATFEASGEWSLDHATSAKAWLVDKCRMSSPEAAEWLRLGRRLRHLPVTRDAWREGKLSGGQVKAILANVKSHLLDVWAEHEHTVVPTFFDLDVAATARAMVSWRLLAEAIGEGVEPPDPVDVFHVASSLDGRVHTQGSHSAAEGAVVERALELARSGCDTDDRPLGERNADALVQVCRFFLDHQDDHVGGRHRPHVNVMIDYDKLQPAQGWLLDGALVASSDMRRLLCDCGVHRVVHRGRSAILDYGSTTRTVPVALYSAIVIRDRHCRFPGCARPAKWCEAHHVIPWWPDRGPTKLSNLVLLCSAHHKLVHKGWRLVLLPDATLECHPPQGRPTLRSRPPP